MTNADDAIHPILKDDYFKDSFGLTKREYFAAMALQGLLAHNAFGMLAGSATREAARFADALIDALNKEKS